MNSAIAVLVLPTDIKAAEDVQNVELTLRSSGVFPDVLIHVSAAWNGQGSVTEVDPDKWWSDFVSDHCMSSS